MKTTSMLAMLLCLLAACHKTPPQADPVPITPTPVTGMDSTDLNNREIAFGRFFSIDLNHDGTKDFYIYTLHVGDGTLQREYQRFHIGTTQNTDVPVNSNEEVPVLTKGQAIDGTAFQYYNWHDITLIPVAQKVTTSNRTWWEGLWKDQFNKYLPVRIRKAGKTYYGWVEISFDTVKEKLILHRAAISRQPDTAVNAGS